MRHADPHARSLRLTAAVAVALAPAAIAPAHAATLSPPGSQAGTVLSAALSSGELTLGEAVSVSGRLLSDGQPRAGAPLTLQADPYPYRGFATLARATSAGDGSFSFTGIRPDRNTQLRVLSEGMPSAAGPVLAATVDPKLVGGARSLGPGRVRLTIRVRHAITTGGRAASVLWFLAARGSRVFRLAASTAARELAPGVTYASVIVDPPVRRFVWRVCLNPSWERAMGTAASHRRCPQASFVVPRHAG
jgi:hypothetical protein